MKTKYLLPLAAVATATLLPGLGLAQEAEASTAPALETSYIFTTLLFLIGGFLVFWMAAGFAMLEAGLVRSKNVTMQLTKNISLFSIAAVMYWLVGFNLMYPGDGWMIAPASAAKPPAACTSVEPAKSEKPASDSQPPPHCQDASIG